MTITDIAPHEPLPSPWAFQRLNEHGHVRISASSVAVDVGDDGLGAPPIDSHARVYLGVDGPQVGTARIHPLNDGLVQVEGVVHDHLVGGRLIRHVGFDAITVTHSRITINDRELGQ